MAACGLLRWYEVPSAVFRMQKIAVTILDYLRWHDVRAFGLAKKAFEDIAWFVSAGRPKALYVCGGCDGRHTLGSAYRFTPSSGKWEGLPPMHEKRLGAAGAVLAGSLFVCGGQEGRSFSRSVECYNPDAGFWKRIRAMSQERAAAAATALERCLVVCGGRDSEGYLSSTEGYDLASDRWQAMPPMREKRGYSTAVKVAGALYICGGSASSRTEHRCLASAERFRLFAADWEALPSMSVPRSGAAGAAAKGRAHVCGGSTGLQGELSSVEAFDSARGVWEAVMPMLQTRVYAGAATVANNMYVFGGIDGQHYLGSMERFNMETQLWEVMMPMPEPCAFPFVCATEHYESVQDVSTFEESVMLDWK